MNIKTNSWHYRWYSWWSTKQSDVPAQENLCHYMRVVLFWSWATWLTYSIGSIFYFLGERTGRFGIAVGNWRIWKWDGWRYVGYGFIAVAVAYLIAAGAFAVYALGYVMFTFTESFFFWTGVVLWCTLGAISVAGVILALATVTLELTADRNLPQLPTLPLPSIKPSMPSIVPLWWAWALAKKHRICPFLTFEEART